MAAPAIETRPSDSTADVRRSNGSGVAEAVLAVVADGAPHSLAQLRAELGVAGTGPTESQLTRALRQLVTHGELVRIRRGVYGLAPAPIVVPSPRSASGGERVPTAKSGPEPEAPSVVLDPVVEESINHDDEPITNAGPVATPLARALSAAPNRPRRPRSDPGTHVVAVMPVVAPKPAVREPVASGGSPDATPVANTVVASEAPAHEVVATQEVGPEVSALDVAVVGNAEVPGDFVDPPEADLLLNEDVRVLDSEQVWVRKAALPVFWFAFTGLALMLAGSVIGAAVGIVLGGAAVGLYVRLRARDRATTRSHAEATSRLRSPHTEFESIGVR